MNIIPLWWVVGSVLTISAVWICFFLARPKTDRQEETYRNGKRVNAYKYERQLQAKLAICLSLLGLILWPVVWFVCFLSVAIVGFDSAVEWLSDKISG